MDPIKQNNKKDKKEKSILKNSKKNKEDLKGENKNLNKIITEADFEYAHKQWKYKTIVYIFMFVLIAVVLSVSITYYITIGKKYNDLYSSTAITTSDETIKASDSINDITKVLSSFATVIDENYVGEINKSDIINSTIKGFVEGIGDEYSEYMTAEEWQEYQASAMGNYSGIGAYMSKDADGNAVIASVIKDSPAEKVGLKTGDIISEINGESVAGKSLSEVTAAAKGEEGTEVTIKIYRNGEYKDFTMTRSTIKIYHVSTKMLDETTGYISLYTFDEGCAQEFETEMDNLINQGATKIILDLRYNTGGIVSEALKIADLFVDKGATTLIEKDNKGNETITISETDKKYNVKLAILMNEYTASSSEILAGALIDNGIPIATIGANTYGKGVIQSVYSLTNGGVLKLTVAEYYTPNKNKINKIGIKPEYEVKLEDVSNYGTENDSQLQKAQEVLK